MRTIATLQEPDSGSIHLGNLDVTGQLGDNVTLVTAVSR